MNRFFITLFLLISSLFSMAQMRPQSGGMRPRQTQGDDPTYLNPKEYIIGAVNFVGIQFLDKNILLQITKLNVGDRVMVPGEATSNAIKNLWAQGLFDDVQLAIGAIRADSIFFDVIVTERPRLTRINVLGLSKGKTNEVRDKLNDKVGKIVNENLLNTVQNIIVKHFNDKGYLNTTVDIKQVKDTTQANNIILDVTVDRKNRVKVQNLTFEGNKEVKTAALRKYMKKTKQRAFYKIFGSGKFNREKYEEDKERLIAKMQDKGYRDAEILNDTVKRHDDKTVDIHIKLHEGPKYYFGDIKWAGNAKYADSVLQRILGIKKGEVFSEEKLEKKLRSSPSGQDVSSLYLNDGYLTFSVDPVQTRIIGDTIDLEIRMYEGPKYTINRVVVKGNEITNDKVIMREIRTKPGQYFNKELVVRTQREIVSLGNFDEQKMDIKPMPNNDGTVDIQYTVAEKPSDQIELSGGFGGGRIIGTLGLTFNNFSARNLFNLKEWKPLPKGDGQKLSIRGQTNGKSYQSYSFSFSEPWLGGKKPVYFGISAFTSLSSNSDYADYYGYTDDQLYRIRLNGITFSLGQRLKWPDDLFQLTYAVNLQQYKLKNYPGFLFSNGTSYNFNLSQEISRNSVDAPIYPTSGSNIKFTIQATPPYSLLNNTNYATASDKEKYRFTEYHKWKFESQWFVGIAGPPSRKLVLKAQAQFGFLGIYNKAVGQSAFERFKLGGDGMQGFDFLQGSEVIAMRGYSNNSVIPVGSNVGIAQASGSPIFNKYMLELRYPITVSQSATMFVLAFAEGGNTWNKFKDFTPFNVRRTAGVGARVFLPIFGLLGIDYGIPFDKIRGVQDNGQQRLTFSIAQQMGGF
ncbi:outer membrane protein assembly factor BamA [Hufsiella ginkgonis]|uniref:Outer membrane protein assembly factor BamA n=1 Tax=Hufsiella ginkgonis TaxID=2695274 RepID=A0A7K1Y3C3_9SPHI|nr:outer membrane protein assembly factor BamA [Hufsiella ginkgonis]MXV17785.1 outer membrane protein assembly factor BamA [Hufsiella ginkgonis]